MTLNQAIAMRQRQAKLMGQRMSRRRMIEIDAEGRATLRLGWLNDVGLTRIEDGDDPTVDMTDMPAGIDVFERTAPDDTVDELHPAPTADEIKAAAGGLGCRHVDRGDCADGTTVYWMVI